MFQYSSASLVALLLTSLCTNPAEARVNTTMSPIYIDNDEYFMNGSNIGSVAFSDIQAAFKSPNLTDEVTFSGYDWTKPFPGSAISGFKTHLRVAYDVPISGDVVEDATTALTSLTYSIPESMMQSDGTLPKPVDPSWYICRHIFVGTKPKISDKIDSACDFLGSECITDLKSSLTKDWMNVTPEVPCSGLGFDPIPSSCRKIFGFARMDVLGIDSNAMSDDEIAKVDAVDVQHPWNWRMGTGYHSPGNTAPREAAAERTYLLVDVWGYSPSADEDTRQTPNATLTCLRPEPVKPDSSDEAIEPSTRTTASTSTTSSAGTPTENSGILGKHAEPVIGLVLLVSLVFMGV